MSFVNCQLGGSSNAFPDTCNTPSVTAVTPVTYANTSTPATAVPACYTILFMGGPAHNITSAPPVSNGDEAGVATGLTSAMVMGRTQHQTASTVLLLKGMPATRLMDVTGHNGMTPNGIGNTQVPCQVKVMALR